MFLEKMKTTDFDPGKKYTFVVPLGSTEQHGPFLPLGTDSYIQDSILERVEKRLSDLIFLPTFRITCSEEHRGFGGSVWVSVQTFESILQDICLSLQPYASHIVFISSHGGNTKSLYAFVETFAHAFEGVRLSYLDDREESTRKMEELLGGPMDEHAGNGELSMMLVEHESLVKIPSTDYPKQIITNAWSTNRLADFSKDGIVDNHPEWIMNKQIGEQIIQIIADDTIERLKAFL